MPWTRKADVWGTWGARANLKVEAPQRASWVPMREAPEWPEKGGTLEWSEKGGTLEQSRKAAHP